MSVRLLVDEQATARYQLSAVFNRQVGVECLANPYLHGEEQLKDGQGKKVHPTQKPEALLERVILVSTGEGDIVLDPLAGTGTTGVVAWRYRRHFLLVEKERKVYGRYP